MPFKKQKAIRSNKKDVIYDLMTDLGLIFVIVIGCKIVRPYVFYLQIMFCLCMFACFSLIFALKCVTVNLNIVYFLYKSIPQAI